MSGGDELRFFPLIGLLAGLGLHLARVPRPPLFQTLNHLLIPASTVVYLTAIGSQLVIEPWRGSSARPFLVMGLIKFAYSPLVGWLLAWLFGLTGLPRFIVLLQASMPVAISPLMLPALFGTDRKLATVLWLSTTLVAIAWLPLYILLIRP
jgi:predicted permease